MKRDWNKLKTEYITTGITYAELAKKHKISATAINERAADEKWVESRKIYREKVEELVINKAADKESTKLARLYSAADGITKVIADVAENTDFYMDDEKNKPNFSDLRTMVNIINSATDMMRKLYGFRSVEQQDTREIELAKIKAEASKRLEEAGDEETGVILLPEMLVEENE